jgi:hypothetical protein
VVIIALIVCVWAGWLAWSPFASRWMRAVAALAPASIIGVTAYTVWGLRDLEASLSAVSSAAERQRALSEGIARVFTINVAVCAAVLVAMVALSVMVRSRRSRARDEGSGGRP